MNYFISCFSTVQSTSTGSYAFNCCVQDVAQYSSVPVLTLTPLANLQLVIGQAFYGVLGASCACRLLKTDNWSLFTERFAIC